MIFCPSCDAVLPSWLVKTGQSKMLCATCFRGISVEMFPALFETRHGIAPEKAQLVEGESCCYEHSTKPAVDACQKCGRFVCVLCKVEMEGQVWCPSCVENSRRDPGATRLQTSRVLYDSIALALATWPLLTVYFTLFGAPIAMYVALRYWKRPSSIIPRNKWRAVVAVLLGLLELGVMCLVVYAAFRQQRSLRAQ